MPITYEHRVPAATLGGLALAAGQEQYEAKRGLEERERAMKLAQMAQQQQMQNQRLAYDAASTQYRTAADYNKFVMGAQLDVQQRMRDQQNRLALQNNQNEMAAGREGVRWDRAQEVQGQGDTFQAWNGYVKDIRGTLNQDGVDILDTHSAKVRSIMSNQKFNQTQKSAAVSQVLEEVQTKNLGESYAREIQYEPGKTYHSPDGLSFTIGQDGKKTIEGRHYDGLMKPDDMSDADWKKTGRNVAWMDEQTVYTTRDDDGKRVRHFISNGEWQSIADEDEVYDAARLEEQQIEREKEEREATTERQKNRATAIKEEMTRIDEIEGKLSSLIHLGKVKIPYSVAEKKAEYIRRMEGAELFAKKLYPDPAGVEEEQPAPPAPPAPPAAPIRDELGGEVPLTEESMVEVEAGEFSSRAAKELIRMSGMASDPEAKAVLLQAAEIHEQIALQGGKPEPHQRAILNQATAHSQRINKMREQRERGTEAGLPEQRRLQRGAALGEATRGAGGTGDRALAQRMAEAGIMVGTPAGDVIMANPDSSTAQALFEGRVSAFPRTPEERGKPLPLLSGGQLGYRSTKGLIGRPSAGKPTEFYGAPERASGMHPSSPFAEGKPRRRFESEGPGRMDSPAEMIEGFEQFRDPANRRGSSKALGLLKRSVQELGLEKKLPDIMKVTPKDLQKKDVNSYDAWLRGAKQEIALALEK